MAIRLKGTPRSEDVLTQVKHARATRGLSDAHQMDREAGEARGEAVAGNGPGGGELHVGGVTLRQETNKGRSGEVQGGLNTV